MRATTKKAGFGDGLLGILAPFSMMAVSDADATPSEVGSAALWDFAKALDPLFLTDLIEKLTGADEYAEENEPEYAPHSRAEAVESDEWGNQH